jgi:Family of unknown function (DUF6252)
MLISSVKQLLCYFLFASIVLVSCDKDGDGDTKQAPGSMTAKIDGKDWKAESVGASILNGITNITGQTLKGEAIAIVLSGDDPGKYALGETSLHAIAYVEKTGDFSFGSNDDGGSGSVEVTEINLKDSTISGTFKAVVTRSLDNRKKEILSGQFTKVKFTTKIPSNPNNSLTCKINGQDFKPTSVFAIKVFDNITVSASLSNGSKGVGFSIPDSTTPGEYDLESSGDFFAQYLVNQSYSTSTSGKLKISKHDKTNRQLEGTFNFEAIDPLGGSSKTLVTAGVFKVKY